MNLLDEVIEAHGGRGRWAEVATIRTEVAAGGLLLRTRVPGTRLAHGIVEVDTGRIRSSAGPFPEPGRRGVFEDGDVRIETDEGEVAAERRDPRPFFFGRSGLRRNLRWDTLDSAYFAGYAWWNYLNFPILLERDGVTVTRGEDWREGGETWRRLEVAFPAGFDTHSPRQTFYVDDRGYLRRHDYVAEIVGGWAHAGHMCEEHVEVDGLVFPRRRRVRPIGPGNRVMPGPTLVALDLGWIEVERR